MRRLIIRILINSMVSKYCNINAVLKFNIKISATCITTPRLYLSFKKKDHSNNTEELGRYKSKY